MYSPAKMPVFRYPKVASVLARMVTVTPLA
jgi:hypothetical protein